jgi:hypothetical protein
MGCVHTHWKISTIEGWGNPSCIWSVVEKIGGNFWKLEKIDRSISQTSALRPKHDKIRTQWALDISSKYDGVNISRWNVEVEPFVAQWIVQMKEDMCELRVVENHMSPWGVDGKGMCYCRLMLRLQEGKDIDEP